ncbi:hypothetical protein [Thalassospira marina]|uniref:Serine/threonine protein phosphatase n=1 Tax=Thalassospira marina TaxID=2048283 RepID=A0A2N3KYZ9_9PROT|nr:hypothetical protein [Thalassospira marina]PKR55799.1 hypothetical protein COO20_00825 [Thalassospira marina]
MSKQLKNQIECTLSLGVESRVFPLHWHGQDLWVKQAVNSKHKVWHSLQRFAAGLLGVPMLRPSVSQGGKCGLDDETSHLLRMRDHGVHVPDLVMASDCWIVLGDNGCILKDQLKAAQAAGRDDKICELITKAAHGLADLHMRDCAHGAPLLRNITLCDDGCIGFIDFEEDPEGCMPIADAQARDVLLFLFSIQREIKKRPDLLHLGWEAYLDQVGQNAPAMRPLASVLRRIFPVYLLMIVFRRWLGTDALNGMQTYQVLCRDIMHGATSHQGQLTRH